MNNDSQLCAGFAQAVAALPKTPGHGEVLPTDLATLADAIRWHADRLDADKLAIGRCLNRAKELIEHGGFETWVKAEFSFTPRTAENYMALAKAVEISENFSFLKPALVYRIVAPGAPDELTEMVAAVDPAAVRDLEPVLREKLAEHAVREKERRQKEARVAGLARRKRVSREQALAIEESREDRRAKRAEQEQRERREWQEALVKREAESAELAAAVLSRCADIADRLTEFLVVPRELHGESTRMTNGHTFIQALVHELAKPPTTGKE
jgi:hypothetical protein